MRETIEALYARFVLRDFVAKIVPGLILLVSLAAIARIPIPSSANEIPIWFAIIGLGMAWPAGYIIQAAGQFSKLIPHDAAHDDLPLEERYEARARLLATASPNELAQLERFIIAKEACGNVCVALLAASLLRLVGIAIDYSEGEYAPLGASATREIVFGSLVLIGATLLKFVHADLMGKQLRWERALRRKRSDASSRPEL